MTTLFTETWTGTNGTAWPDPPWTKDTSNGSAYTIQSNAGRMLALSGGTASAALDFNAGLSARTSQGVTATFTMNSAGWAAVSLGNYSGDVFINSGYQAIVAANDSELAIWDCDATATPSKVAVQSRTISLNTAYKIKLQRLGGTVNAKLWLASGSEPANWDLTYTDPSPWGGGYPQLGAFGASGQVTVTWDDLVVTDGPFGTNYTATPADSIGVVESLSQVRTVGKAIAETVGLTDSGVAYYEFPISRADTMGLTDAVTIGVVKGPPGDFLVLDDDWSHTKANTRIAADDAIIREAVTASIAYGEVQDYQFLINVAPRVQFGLGQTVNVSEFDPGSADIRAQDSASPVGDYRMFGTDRRTPPVWAWTLWTDAYSAKESLGWNDLLNQVWDNDVRQEPGGVVSLTYAVGGRLRRVYGRPRRYTATPDAIQFGRMHIAADFALAEDVYYDEEEQGTTIGIRTGFIANSGLIIPATVPWRFTTGTAPRTELIKIEGTQRTWATIVIEGPVANPWVQIGDVTFGLVGSVASGQTLTLSGRPWEQGVLRSDGAWVPQMLDPRARLSALRLAPAEYPVTYGGTDNTGTSRCTVSWRNAYRSL